MDFNLTGGEDEELYFKINTAITVSLLFICVLPTLVLCLLCVMALLFADAINWPVRVLLINIFAAEVCFWLAISVYFIGFPVRAGMQNGTDHSCNVVLSLLSVADLQKFTSIAIYAIAVYVYLRFGEEKLKWYFIVAYLAASWTVTIAISLPPYFDAFEIFESHGFCENHTGTSLFKAYLALFIITVITFLFIIILFGLLTYCYIKKNTLKGSDEVKRAVSKYLLYLNIATILSFICDIVPLVSFPFIREAVGTEGLRDQTLLGSLWIILQLPSVIIPITAILILKPIGDALKQGMMKCTCCKRDEEEHKLSEA